MDPTVKYLYLAALKYSMRLTQLGVCPDTREKIAREVAGYRTHNLEDDVLDFIQKYSTTLGRASDEKTTGDKAR